MKIVLAGNQNSGKTTIFNYLTNELEKIGNWPGVTIKRKEGIIKNTNHTLIDLPGIYSLSPYSKEEELSTNFLIKKEYDLIINIIDINLLERSLFLTTELLELDKNIIILLTHTNDLTKKELLININQLEKKLNVKFITKEDIKKSINNSFNSIRNKKIKIFSKDIENLIMKISNNRYKSINEIKNNKLYSKLLIDKYQMEINELISFERYKYIESITSNIIIKKKKNILDKILLNKILGIPLFIIIMTLIYYFSIGIVGNYTNNINKNIINNINSKIIIILKNLNVYDWLINLITNGIINGLGIIINFIPQLLSLFIFTEILNQTGYITRITYLLDGLFNKLGLSGKSIIPFILGTSCSVQGIMQTRIIENKSKRDRTILLTPFIPCTAKLPIIIIISNYFISKNYFIIVIYLYSILVVILSSLILKKIYITKEHTFIIELPMYQIPKLKHLLEETINKIKEFIKRTSSIILTSSLIIWLLLSFSTRLEYITNIENSILSYIGKKISFIFYPFLGTNNWKLSIAILQGIVAKEQIVSSLNIITNNNILNVFTPASSLSFLTFNLFSIPCINTIIAMKQELGSIKKLLLSMLFQFIIAFILSVVIYQVGNLLW